MAVTEVRLEDEAGEVIDRVADTGRVLTRLLPSVYDEAYPMLRFVDPYGDTIFNRLQADSLADELRRRSQGAAEPDQAFLKELLALVERCQREVHLYIRFFGD